MDAKLGRHRGKWAVKIDGKRISTGLDATDENRPEAERRVREVARRALQYSHGQTVAGILSAYIEDFQHRARPVVAPDSARYAAAALTAFFTSHTAEDVTREECRAYIAHRRAAGRKDGTIIREIGVLKAALRWHDPRTPARFDAPSTPPPRKDEVTEDEVLAMVRDRRNAPHIRLFILLAIVTGGRREALLDLTWGTHIDFDKGQVWLGFKASGKKRGTVPMTRRLRRYLRVAQSRATTPYVIEFNGSPVSSVRTGLRKAFDRAGIEGRASAHDLRRSSGCIMARRGVPMVEISKRLEHSSIAVTEKHYAHIHPDYMQASTEALEI